MEKTSDDNPSPRDKWRGGAKEFFALIVFSFIFINFTTAATVISDTSINSTDINLDGNLTLGQKITFVLGEIIDNLVDGWVRVTGGLNVTGDVEIGGNLGLGSNNITNIDSIASDRINEFLYVQAGNSSDIQATINKCNPNGCVVVNPYGNYALDNTLNLTSNLTFINYGHIYWNTGATPQILTDAQSATYNQMIFGNNLENVKIFNYGILETTKIHDPSGGEQAIHINNSNNIKVLGGNLGGGITNAGSGVCIYNTNNSEVYSIHSDGLNDAVWQECTQKANIHDVNCIAGGHEGECIEMNGYSQYVTISNIMIEGGSEFNDQSIDLNANKYVTLNNIIGKNAYRLIGDSMGSGIRFGASSPITGSYITGTNLQCHNCNVTSIPVTTNSSWDILEGGLSYRVFRKDYGFTDRVLIGGNDSSTFSDQSAELEITDIGVAPIVFLYPTGLSDPELAGQIAFGEGSDAITHMIQLDGSTNDIEFKGYVAGNQFGFDRDTAGLIVYPNSTSADCNANQEGAIYYDGTTKKHYGCNSTTWTALY